MSFEYFLWTQSMSRALGYGSNIEYLRRDIEKTFFRQMKDFDDLMHYASMIEKTENPNVSEMKTEVTRFIGTFASEYFLSRALS